MKRRYIQYDKLTEAFSRTPKLDEQDLLEAPDHIIYFRTNEERDAFRRQLETVHSVTPVASSSASNINSIEETEVKIESMTEVSIEKSEWGGKRNGVGRKKGTSIKHSAQTKLEISKSMKGKRNAAKDK